MVVSESRSCHEVFKCPLSSCRASPVTSEELLVSCGFLLCKGLVSHMDMVSVHLCSSPRLFSFLSLAWGFVADVDIESEKYRHFGAVRFTIGTLVRLASLRVYKGRLAYLPATKDHNSEEALRSNTMLCKDRVPPVTLPAVRDSSFHNSCHSNNSLKVRRVESTPSRSATKTLPGPHDSLLPPLDQPLPDDWVVVPEEDFVLMLAMYQSHLAEDLLAAPEATLDDGVIHLFYVRAGISPTALLRLFLAMEKGAHLTTNCQHLVYTKVRALRLEPYSPKGIITVDGEVVDYGPVQAEVHRGLSRLITGWDWTISTARFHLCSVTAFNNKCVSPVASGAVQLQEQSSGFKPPDVITLKWAECSVLDK